MKEIKLLVCLASLKILPLLKKAYCWQQNNSFDTQAFIFFQLQFIGGCAATSDKMNLNWVKGSVSFFYYSPFHIHATYLLDSIWNWNLVLGNWKLGMIIITCVVKDTRLKKEAFSKLSFTHFWKLESKFEFTDLFISVCFEIIWAF